MIKYIKLYLTLVFVLGCTAVWAQNIDDVVNKGIKTSISQTENNLWSEAFATCRALDQKILLFENENNTKKPELNFLVAKERFRIYKKIKRVADCQTQLDRMNQFANESKTANLQEDYLITKASFLEWTGKQAESNACYNQIVQLYVKGKNIKDADKEFKQLLEKSKQSEIPSYTLAVEKIYSKWQDSIAAAKASEDLKELQNNYDLAQNEISEKESKINWQYTFIILLLIVVVGLIAALLFAIGLFVKKSIQMNKMKKSLNISNENNMQKNNFIDKLGDFILPSIDAIEAGNLNHIPALKKFIAQIRKYMQLEMTREELYELNETSVQTWFTKTTEEIKENLNITIPVKTDFPRISFNINEEAMKEIMTGILTNVIENGHTETIYIAFKKNGAKTGKLLITAEKMDVSPEEREILFKPFSQVEDLTKGDVLNLPTCCLIAYKMNGNLHLDETYTRGLRFLIDLHN